MRDVSFKKVIFYPKQSTRTNCIALKLYNSIFHILPNRDSAILCCMVVKDFACLVMPYFSRWFSDKFSQINNVRCFIQNVCYFAQNYQPIPIICL